VYTFTATVVKQRVKEKPYVNPTFGDSRAQGDYGKKTGDGGKFTYRNSTRLRRVEE
jgi:hypothetical protein